VPAVNAEVVNETVPPERKPVLKSVAPSVNFTFSPFGGAPDPELTVAVKVTEPPTFDGLFDDVSAVVVTAFVTVCVCAAEVLAT
jgi:hypothetical protein